MSDILKSPLCKDGKHGTRMSAKHRVNKHLSLLMMPNAPEHLLPSPFTFPFYLYVATMFSFTTDLLVNATASDGSVNDYCKKAFKSNPALQIRHQEKQSILWPTVC